MSENWREGQLFYDTHEGKMKVYCHGKWEDFTLGEWQDPLVKGTWERARKLFKKFNFKK